MASSAGNWPRASTFVDRLLHSSWRPVLLCDEILPERFTLLRDQVAVDSPLLLPDTGVRRWAWRTSFQFSVQTFGVTTIVVKPWVGRSATTCWRAKRKNGIEYRSQLCIILFSQCVDVGTRHAAAQRWSTYRRCQSQYVLVSYTGSNSVQCYAWTEYKFTCVGVSVCMCVRHTYCQVSTRLQVRPLNGFLSRVSILTRDIDIANLSVRPSVCVSIRLSVTFRYQMKTA